MASLLAALKAQPDVAPPPADTPATLSRRYRYWRFRILSASLVGYAIYYFVRTNISVPLPDIQQDLGYTKAQLGIVLTVGSVTYGISKFVNGFVGDRSNPRYFMAAGLLLSAAMNVLFGLSSALPCAGGFWLLNNWAQGMGFPPCAATWATGSAPRTLHHLRHLAHRPHRRRGLVAVLTGYILHCTGNWRLCFHIPAAIAVGGAVMLMLRCATRPARWGCRRWRCTRARNQRRGRRRRTRRRALPPTWSSTTS